MDDGSDAGEGVGAPIRDRRETVLSDAWGRLTRHSFSQRMRDGTWSPQTREIYDHGHAAACLAHDRVRGTVLLVRQFRLPMHLHDGAAHDGLGVEAPAGLIEPGEDAGDAMAREMEEETGFRCRELRQVADLFSSPGSLSERMVLFAATYCAEDRVGPGGGVEGEGEDIEVLEVPLAEAIAMIGDGRVRDLKTAFLILHAARETP